MTVLMPVKSYDPDYLECSLSSLFAQTDPEWRLLVIAEARDAPRLRHRLQPRLGDARMDLVANERLRLAGAINTGMVCASSDFVALLFADDLWDHNAIEVLGSYIRKHPEADFFHSSRRIIDDRGKPISSVHRAQPQVSLADFRTEAPVKHLLCWRRSMALEIGGLDDRSHSVGPDDFDFPWSTAEHGANFQAIDECLYVYRDHRRVERLTTHLPRRVHASELRRIFRKHGLTRREIRIRLREAQETYLRQCLYRSHLERSIRQYLRKNPAVWRDQYE